MSERQEKVLAFLREHNIPGITGAIVGRQPFGGMKLSAFGPGLKAGGPNYVAQFMHITDKGSTTDYRTSYSQWYEKEFRHARNLHPEIRGEQNVFRYLPLQDGIVLRLFGDESLEKVKMVCLAAKTVHTPLTISLDKDNVLLSDISPLCTQVKTESVEEFCKSIKKVKPIVQSFGM